MEIHKYFHIYLHSFTIVVLDDKDIECEISCKIKHLHEAPGWRNWQTQRTQNPPVLGTLGVRLPLPAPYPLFVLKDLQVLGVSSRFGFVCESQLLQSNCRNLSEVECGGVCRERISEVLPVASIFGGVDCSFSQGRKRLCRSRILRGI